ncbi:MAG: gamma-glutamyltransferase [Acidobacteriota bacterium]|nr:MAG: gamma-glutamyltransferase [Acidobacteriota bacterium]
MRRPLLLVLLLTGFLPGCRPAERKDAGAPLSRGVVVAPEPVAAEVGARILRRGGNAVDAAVAVQFALAVTTPLAGNVGGGGFAVLYDPSSEQIHALDYRETAPLAAHPDLFLDASGELVADLNLYSHLAAGVPGTVHGMWELHQSFGSLPWTELLGPAIELAAAGWTLDEYTASEVRQVRERYAEIDASLRKHINFDDYFHDQAGQPLVQTELAETLRRIASDGPVGFYRGETAQLIVEEMRRGNGVITLEDLRGYRSVWRQVVEGRYQGLRVASMPPPSSGGAALIEMLNMFELFERPPWHSARHLHLVAEIEKRVFADRAEHLGDPDFFEVPLGMLIDESYARDRAEGIRIDVKTDPSTISAGALASLTSEGPHTCHFSIVDRQGMSVANTTSINRFFGSGIVVRGAGFLLNNHMDDFSAKPGVPNVYCVTGGEANKIEPGKRMLSSMSPTIVFDQKNEPWLVLGSPGGPTIFTSVFQVIVNRVDYDMSLEEAVLAPRFHHQWPPPSPDRDPIVVEAKAPFRLPDPLVEQLRSYGYDIETRATIGSVQAIEINDSGPIGVADARRNAAATYE